ncbi:MAG: hypothetical protein K6B74_10830 [Ruminococcus sp.]|nr:hypothetical protein [Ruminococcus sp.]
MTEEEARKIAEPVVEGVVNCMAEKNYAEIEKYAAFCDDMIPRDVFIDAAEDYLVDNGLDCYDRYGAPNNFKPQYDISLYHQLEIYVYDNGTGFGAEYDLTTNGELNDLTLMLEFRPDENGVLQPYIEDIHVL